MEYSLSSPVRFDRNDRVGARASVNAKKRKVRKFPLLWHGDRNAATKKMTQIEYRVVHYYARYAKTQRYEPPTVCCRTWGRCNSWTQKARDPSMSRGENCRRHNTIEDIIIVKGGKGNTTTSRVRWHFQPALLTKRVLARIAHIKKVVLIPETIPISVS